MVPDSRVLLLLEPAPRMPRPWQYYLSVGRAIRRLDPACTGMAWISRSTLRASMKPGAAGRQGGSRSEVGGGGMCRRCSSILMA